MIKSKNNLFEVRSNPSLGLLAKNIARGADFYFPLSAFLTWKFPTP
jgi:hypothetical protein